MILSTINRIIGGDGAAAAARRQRRRALSRQMAGLLLLCSLIIATLAPHTTSAYPSGAPDSACKDLKPGHGGEASTSSSPFELTQDILLIGAGEQIKVTLSSPSKTNFKGLIVQAVGGKGEPATGGKFLAGKGLKVLESCSAVTHTDREEKKTATLVWEAASNLKAKMVFTFRATVVVKFDEYYMNITSKFAK